jgi:biopolymer transport protein ExbB
MSVPSNALFLTASLAAATVFGQTDFDEKLGAAALEYTQRIEVATTELNAARDRVANEKVPLLNQMRGVEDRILSLRAETSALQISTGQFANERAQLDQVASSQRINVGFYVGLANEGLSTLNSSLGNTEIAQWKDRTAELRQRIAPATRQPDLGASIDAVEFLLGRVETLLGGYTAKGRAVSSTSNKLVDGTYVFMGPETFFVSSAPSEIAGTVRAREEGAAPSVFPLPGWDNATGAAFVSGNLTSVPIDVSGGKALQLRQSQGDWLDHIRKGGVVGYSIIGLGIFALLTSLVKLIDLRKLSVDKPSAVTQLLESLARNGPANAQTLLGSLRATSRDLFTTGLRYAAKPKEVIEEHLYAFILRERLHHERWLPMLAVIAAASPLLGLLGTVVGMVKTFTLITVFGTGNAGKLSSGISEALITTELGLIVAIPTLILHGLLSHRTQKSLSLLERYGVELVTANEENRATAND